MVQRIRGIEALQKQWLNKHTKKTTQLKITIHEVKFSFRLLL